MAMTAMISHPATKKRGYTYTARTTVQFFGVIMQPNTLPLHWLLGMWSGRAR
jgi:hypothetical protein